MTIADKIQVIHNGNSDPILLDTVLAEVERLQLAAPPPTTGRAFVLTLDGLPPTENHMRKSWRGRKPALTPEVHAFRRRVAAAVIRRSGLVSQPLAGRLAVHVVYHAPDARRRDGGNLTKALYDAMSLAGVWIDDSQIDVETVERGPVTPGGLTVVNVREIAGCPPVKKQRTRKARP